MASSRYINTNFWRDNYILELDPSEKLLFMYFLTNPNTTIAGVYEINLRQVAFDVGFDVDMVKKILKRFCDDGKMHYHDGWLILRNFIKHQRINPSVRQGIDRVLEQIPASLNVTVREETINGHTLLSLEIGDSLHTDSPQTDTLNFNLNLNSNLTKLKPIGNAGKPDVVAKSTRQPSVEINELFEYWHEVIGYKIDGQVKNNRFACSNLLKKYKPDGLRKLVNLVHMAHQDPYAGRAGKIADFRDLQANLSSLNVWMKGKVSEQTKNAGVKL